MKYRIFSVLGSQLFTAYAVVYDSDGNVSIFDCIGSSSTVEGIGNVIESHADERDGVIEAFDEITETLLCGRFVQNEERIEIGTTEVSPGSVIIATVNHDGMSKVQADEYDQAISAKLKASFKDHRHIVVDQRITLSVLDISGNAEITGSDVQR